MMRLERWVWPAWAVGSWHQVPGCGHDQKSSGNLSQAISAERHQQPLGANAMASTCMAPLAAKSKFQYEHCSRSGTRYSSYSALNLDGAGSRSQYGGQQAIAAQSRQADVGAWCTAANCELHLHAPSCPVGGGCCCGQAPQV